MSLSVGKTEKVRSGGLAVCRKNLPIVGLGEKPAAKWGTLFLGNRPNRPLALLGEQDSFWIPSGGERVTHICCWVGLSLTPGPGRAKPVGNPSSPCKRLIWGRREQDENCP